jgi:hypothetical protein
MSLQAICFHVSRAILSLFKVLLEAIQYTHGARKTSCELDLSQNRNLAQATIAFAICGNIYALSI